MTGRIEGKVEGDFYVIRQGDTVLRSIPLADADEKLRASIKRNSWGPLP